MEGLTWENATLARRRQRRNRRNAILALLGCLVVFATAYALTMPAISMTHGDLVCGMEEHQHADACYQQVLVCGQEEDESHQHTDSCYETQLVCGLNEHVHDDSCYAPAPDAQAGEDAAQADANQANGPVDSSHDGDAGTADAEKPGSDAEDTNEADSAMPAQRFEETVYFDTALKVVAEAPEGAFPEGTTMKVEAVPSYNVENQVSAAVSTRTDAEVDEIRAVDITFRNKDGREIEPAKRITVRMTSAFIDQESPLLVHVDDHGNAEVVNPLDERALAARLLSANDDDLYFESDEFSKYVLVSTDDAEAQEEAAAQAAVVYSAPMMAAAAAYQSGSIMDGIAVAGANDWQIVSGGYTGNATGNKTLSSDGYVRVQKNVIPTGVENEFLVYLSVDKKTEVTTQQFSNYISDTSHYVVGSASHFPSGVVKGGLGNLQGQEKGGVTVNSNSKKNKTYTITLTYGGVVLGTALFEADCSNSCVYFKLRATANHNDVAYIALYEFKSESTVSVELTDAAYERLAEEVVEYSTATNVALNSVTDQMGDYIVYGGVVDGDYSTVPQYDESNGTLVWVPAEKANPETETTSKTGSTTSWRHNTAELVYRVRLDVTKDGFNSCALNMSSTASQPESYKVNNNAILQYKRSDQSNNSTVSFPVPYVRGLLYDMKVKKVDESGNSLSGAQFLLTGTSGTTGTDVAASAAASISTEQLVSGSDGYLAIAGLPWGTYTLTEITPPSGYSVDAAYASGKQVTLCQTTVPSTLANNASHKILKEGSNAYLTVVNKKNVITFTKQVGTQGDMRKAEVDHTVYIALWDSAANDYVRDSKGDIVSRQIVITAGVPEPATVTFEGIDTGFYDVYELASVDGADYTELSIGSDTFVNSQNTEFQLAAIEGVNDVDLRNGNTANVTLKNVYSYPANVDFVANKKWAGSSWTELQTAPSGAQVTFTLYRGIAEGGPYAAVDGVDPIMLDGRVDSRGETAAWQATFANQPKQDAAGNRYYYAVRETSCSTDEFEPWLDRTAAAPMGASDYLTSNGGTIWNKQKSTSITVKKVDDKGAFLPGARFKLFRVDPDPSDPSVGIDVLMGNEFTVGAESGITLNGLVSGNYKLVEVGAPDGFVILEPTVEFSVNATGSGAVVAWRGGQPGNALALSGANSDTITVVNTPGHALPNTGGTGTLPYTLGGSALVAAALVYGFRMRRRGRRCA